MRAVMHWLNRGGLAFGAVCATALSAIEIGTYGITGWGVGLIAAAIGLLFLGTADDPKSDKSA